jgi:hypothetical protein
MAGSVRNCLVGCGIGCGALLLVFGALAVGGFFAVRNVVEDFERTESSARELADRLGSIDDFTPEPDGTIPADRIEAFLAVREQTRESREEMEQTLSLLADGKEGTGRMGPRRVARMVTAGLGLLPEIAEFLARRNEAMLEQGMGPGEYLYIYTVAYYSWLGRSPADGPPFRLVGGSHEHRRDDADEGEVREDRRERTARRLNRSLEPMLRRQAAGVGGDDAWRGGLEAEIAAMAGEADRLPWRDGVPEPLGRSLEPYRERLELSYSAPCNPLETMFDGP